MKQQLNGSPTFPIGCKFFVQPIQPVIEVILVGTMAPVALKMKTPSGIHLWVMRPKTFDSVSNSAGWCMNPGQRYNCINPLGDGYAKSNGETDLPKTFNNGES